MESRVSNAQLEDLLDYLSSHRGLAQGVGMGARSKENQDRLWKDLAEKLNSHGSGATKTAQRWKRYWISLKHKVKARVATQNRDLHGTGGGPPSQQNLSEIDNKVLSIIGTRAVFGDTEHRIPVNIPQPSTSSAEIIPLYTEEVEDIVSTDTHHDFNVYDAVQNLSPERHTPTEQPACPPPLPSPSPSLPITPAAPKQPPKTKTLKKVEPEWLIKLEERRVAAEEKLAEAVSLLAQAAIKNADAANTMAQAALLQAETHQKLVNLINNSNSQ